MERFIYSPYGVYIAAHVINYTWRFRIAWSHKSTISKRQYKALLMVNVNAFQVITALYQGGKRSNTHPFCLSE